MSIIFTSDCPRCRVKKTTFDVKADNFLEKDHWMHISEIYCVCRHCSKGSILIVRQTNSDLDRVFANGITNYPDIASLNSHAELIRPVTIADLSGRATPEFLEGRIAVAFKEASRCETVGCYNAAAAMFRTCLDLLTKPMLPSEGETPSSKVRRSLGLRLQWLIQQGSIPKDLESEIQAVQLDGNDGAHDASLTKADAADIGDFTEIIIERLVTNPKKLALAAERRATRRN